MSDRHPELDGYEPGDGRPLRGRRRMLMMRVIVSVGLLALVLPGVLVTASTASATAATACRVYADYYAPDAVSESARFTPIGPEGPGWYCYVTSFNGQEILLRPLGLIPGAPVIPSGPTQRS